MTVNVTGSGSYNVLIDCNDLGQGVIAHDDWADGFNVTLSASTVTAGNTFNVTFTAPAELTKDEEGSYEGYIVLEPTGDGNAIYMPFAALVVYYPPVMTDYSFARNVISPMDYDEDDYAPANDAFDYTSGAIVLNYTTYPNEDNPYMRDTYGTYQEYYLFKRQGFNPASWEDSYCYGVVGTSFLALDDDFVGEHSVFIGDGWYYPVKTEGNVESGLKTDADGDLVMELMADGDYIIAWENYWVTDFIGKFGKMGSKPVLEYAGDLYLSLKVDAKKPVLRGVNNDADSRVIYGKITDDQSPVERLRLFAIWGEEEYAVPVDLDSVGNFSFTAPTGVDEVTFYALDWYDGKLPVIARWPWLDDILMGYRYGSVDWMDDLPYSYPDMYVAMTDDFYPIEWEYSADEDYIFTGNNITKLVYTLKTDAGETVDPPVVESSPQPPYVAVEITPIVPAPAPEPEEGARGGNDAVAEESAAPEVGVSDETQDGGQTDDQIDSAVENSAPANSVDTSAAFYPGEDGVDPAFSGRDSDYHPDTPGVPPVGYVPDYHKGALITNHGNTFIVVVEPDGVVYVFDANGTPLGYIVLKPGQSIDDIDILAALLPLSVAKPNPTTGDMGGTPLMALTLLLGAAAVVAGLRKRYER